MPLIVAPDVVFPDDLLTESFVRAAGPGGQNVNKVSTAVELRVDLSRVPLAPEVVARLRSLAGHRVTTEGMLVVEAREHRTQGQNREAAREKLAALVRQALITPRSRRKTRPSRASRERRLESKGKRSAVKAGRRSRGDD